MPWTKRTESPIAEPVDELLGAAAGLRLGDQHAARRRARCAAWRTPPAGWRCPSSGRRRWPWRGSGPGTRGLVGGTKPSSTPSRITCIRAGSTPKSVAMSRAEVSDGVRILRALRATLPCIRRKPYQRRSVSLLAPGRRRREVDPAVEGDRVVQRGDQRQPHLLDVEHAVAERPGCRARCRSRRPGRAAASPPAC